MAKFSDITLDVKVNPKVDRRTAETCLRLVEIFCNDRGINVVVHRNEDGYTTFEFEDENKPKISPMAYDALNAMGRKSHGEV